MSATTNVIQDYQWTSVQWPKAHKVVQNLRQRIFRATKAGDFKKVKQLQKLMLRCTSNILVSVRRVTQVNAGKNTPGVDKVLVKTPAERTELVKELTTYTPWKVKPVKRVYRTEKSKSLLTSKGIRQKLFNLQKGICPVCKQPLENLDETGQEELHIHHVKPRKHGGTNKLDNLRLIHLYCHQQEHSKA